MATVMRVLMINPPPHHRVDQYDEPDFPRLGLACLARQLLTGTESEVEIIDAKLERLSHSRLMERVRAFAPDIVGLTALTNEIEPSALVARLVKQLSPKTQTVIGGVHVSVLPAETMLEFPELDYGVVGEGEITFCELVQALERGDELEGVAGLVFRDNGKLVQTTARERACDLDSYGAPAWDLLPRSDRYLCMTQRGCPYQCTFCVNPNGRTVRQRSVASVVDEICYVIDRFHPHTLYMCDEIFTLDSARTHQLLDAMIEAGVHQQLVWTAQTHVNCVDRELFVKMKAAGCSLCGLGIESGDPEIMRRTGKGITLDRVRAARRAADEVGLPVEILMILGHPGETWQTARRSIDLAVELNGDSTLFGIMVPYPGTQVFELAQRGEAGYRLISNDWNDYNKQIGDALELEHLSRAQLELLQLAGYVEVLLKNGRLVDLARFVHKYRREGWAVVRKLLLRRKPRPVVIDPVVGMTR